MKTYRIFYDTLASNKIHKIFSENKNIQELFLKIKKELSNINILYIEEVLSSVKAKRVYDKFYYLDKKSGLPIRSKYINIGKQNTSKTMIIRLIKERRFKDAFLASKYYILYGFKGDFRKTRSIVEKYFIKNGFPILAKALNNTHITDKVKDKRKENNFNLSTHLWKRDLSSNTKGCGCNYCVVCYYRRKYQLEYLKFKGDYQIFLAKFKRRRAYQINNDIPYTTSGRILMERKHANNIKLSLDKYKKFDSFKKSLELQLQIPKDARI